MFRSSLGEGSVRVADPERGDDERAGQDEEHAQVTIHTDIHNTQH